MILFTKKHYVFVIFLTNRIVFYQNTHKKQKKNANIWIYQMFAFLQLLTIRN